MYRRNQFGATTGGPVVKDRTFFFADHQGQRQSRGLTYSVAYTRSKPMDDGDPVTGCGNIRTP